ncbi:hypothetical protein [Kutzneria kofuensis]|uniref:Uncharacterized protein n=1 Tax=Kutzneria kofuensis TaxID=103725 RepID=A0A7W9KBZ6_9PSEU|nr:hypothetical protein [Kutzneria kofuensis]MBB5889721.1 hypothetical protein [Kutzneria kofuensis]
MRRRPGRWLGVGAERYLWGVGHCHEPGATSPCREVVWIRRERSHGRLFIIFAPRDGHHVYDGYPMHSGQVLHADGRDLNLNQPGVARALLDAARAGGWEPLANASAELDGWALFDAVNTTTTTSGRYFPRAE